MAFSERQHDRDALLRWHTLTEVAEMLGVSIASVSRYVSSGMVEAVSAHGAILLHDEDVAYLAAKRKARI